MFLFVRGLVGHTARVLMVETARFAPLGAQRLSPERRRTENRRGARQASRLVEAAATADPSFALAQSAPQGDTGLPTEVQHVGWTYVETGTAIPPTGFYPGGDKNGIGAPQAGSQQSAWTINHSFDVYLDNGAGHPQGNYQVLTYNLNGEFNPAVSGVFFQMDNCFKIGFTCDKVMERAWWTGRVNPLMVPALGTGTDQKLVWKASQPATPNQEHEYTSGNDFQLGFTASTKEGAGIDASYNVNNERSNTIADWGVANETEQNNLRWEFSSRDPCDVSGDGGEVNSKDGCFDESGPGIRSGLPNRPNDLSLGQLQFFASGRYQTESVLAGQAAELGFDVATTIELVDTYCDGWFIGWCGTGRYGALYGILNEATEHWLDVSAVNPIPIESVELSPNPANGAAHQNVTGTVKLERPAPMDLTVLIYSNSQNAVVGAPVGGGPESSTTVHIPTGKDSASFEVQTNDNGIQPGGHTTAAITAFYTEGHTTQLQVDAGTPNSFTPLDTPVTGTSTNTFIHNLPNLAGLACANASLAGRTHATASDSFDLTSITFGQCDPANQDVTASAGPAAPWRFQALSATGGGSGAGQLVIPPGGSLAVHEQNTNCTRTIGPQNISASYNASAHTLSVNDTTVAATKSEGCLLGPPSTVATLTADFAITPTNLAINP